MDLIFFFYCPQFWNIHKPEEEEEVIVTDTPIWRARNTPFGNGVLIMPQRTDSKLTLYSRACAETPVHAFDGHQDTVKEFVWRWKGDINGSNGGRNYSKKRNTLY